MHELSLVEEIYEICQKSVEEQGGGIIQRVIIKVGPFAGAEPELLRFAWEAITRDTPHEGSKMEILWDPPKGNCPACGPVTPEGEKGLIYCPHCFSFITPEGGDALEIVKLYCRD